MDYLKRLASVVLGAALLAAEAFGAASPQVSRADLVKKSDLVFIATVTEVGKASFAGVPESARTIIVRVDSVIEKPSAVPVAPGDRVTVRVNDPSRFRKGTRATFYAQGWILGAGLAVREVGHEPIPKPKTAAAATTETGRDVKKIRRQTSDAQLKAQIRAADMVVAGRVVSVQPHTMQAAGAPARRITEHDPDWQEAVIQVDSAIKGTTTNNRALVRFPASRDVQWLNAPKFAMGQEGVFILRLDRVSGAPRALLSGSEVPAYTALRPADVLPSTEVQRIRGLARP